MPKMPDFVLAAMAKRPCYQEEVSAANAFLRAAGINTKTARESLKGMRRSRKTKELDEWHLMEGILEIALDFMDNVENRFSVVPKDEKFQEYVPSFVHTSDSFNVYLTVNTVTKQVVIPFVKSAEIFQVLPDRYTCHGRIPSKEGDWDIYMYSTNLTDWVTHLMRNDDVNEAVYEYLKRLNEANGT